MSRLFYHTCQDNAGNLLFDVSGTMRLAGTGTLATIYGDEALTVILPNPMTNHPSFGSFKCFLPPGDFDFYLAKSGYTFETLTGVQGHGTMAQQDAASVAITGGSATGLAQLGVIGPVTITGTVTQSGGNVGLGGAASVPLEVFGATFLRSFVGVGQAPNASFALTLLHNNAAAQHGIEVRAFGADTGAYAQLFTNVAGTPVGSIQASATATAFNTTSDSRLKHDVEPLTGELALIRALRPVSFLWNADESPGVGFIASEVAAHVQGVITGDEDELNPDGTIKPQMIDMSKLVPFLVGACQTLARRLAVLEDALGI